MTYVWIVTVNGRVEAVCENEVAGRQAMQDAKARLEPHGGRWWPIGGDVAKAMGWASNTVTSLHLTRWAVEPETVAA